MVGPSSSHTAGAVRIGAFARRVLGTEPATALVQLHGSFAATGEGHGTHLALLAGLLGLAPDDERIPRAEALAASAASTTGSSRRTWAMCIPTRRGCSWRRPARAWTWPPAPRAAGASRSGTSTDSR